MIDTHAHLQDEKYENIDEIINNALNFDVNKIVCASSSVKASLRAVEIATKYENIFATIGIHPEEAGEWNDQTKELFKQLAKNEKVKAIGEIGLDYHYEFFSRDMQKQVFIEQIKLANELNLPIVIHSRDASGDMLEIIREYKDYLINKTTIHCYNMGVGILKEIISYGFNISLGGAITFKNARGLLDVVKECPIENLMLETDAPYMSPEPYRGKLNEPKNVKFVAQKIADLKGLTFEEVARITTENAIKFFKLGN